MTVTVITPWLNCSELIPTYEKSVEAAHQVIVIDNASEWHHARKLEQMVSRLGGCYVRNEVNNLFAPANNQGLRLATGDVVVFMNNDAEFRGSWDVVERETPPNRLVGPSLKEQHGVPYLEGHFIAARLDTWKLIGGWPELDGMYWEDNILCLEAVRKGVRLIQAPWPVWHESNYTSRQTRGAYDYSQANQREFLRRLQAWQPSQ